MYLQKEKKIQRKGLQNTLDNGENRVLQARPVSLNSSSSTLSEEVQNAVRPSGVTDDDELAGGYSVNAWNDPTEAQADRDADKALS